MRRRTARALAVALALTGALVVLLVASRLFPYHSLNHDEGVYLRQAALLRNGQFSLYPPVEDVFRPWFFVEDGDRLYPKYAPVPAAMFAVGQAFGAARLVLAGIGGGIVALTVRVVGSAFDRETGLLAGVAMLASPLFLLTTSVFLPYAPTAVLNLAFAAVYFRADRTGDPRWAAVAGVAVGLAFFARPYTAVLFALPFIAHAVWTLWRDFCGALPRQALTAAGGLLGVASTLAYNAVVTGSPWLFPYAAFAPLDGLGFGERRLLGHTVDYTPTLALRVNAEVLEVFATDWVAGGALGALLAAVGLAAAVRRGLTPKQAVLAGLFVTIPLGNVYFWGNYNILGVVGVPGDGLVAYLGPYYHFDLLLPTAAFAARGAVAVTRAARELAERSPDPRRARAVAAIVLLVGAAAFGAATVGAIDAPADRNAEVTETYRTAYEPFESGPPANSLVFLPSTYGPWLGHPFQSLRNDPGFDGDVVYALDDRPFATAAAFPNRTLYRYGYRGVWNPAAGSPTAARLQAVERVRGERVGYTAALGVPNGVQGVTLRLGSEERAAYRTLGPVSNLSVAVTVANGTATLTGDGVDPVTIPVDDRDEVGLTVFLDYGPGGSFSYGLELPVERTAGGVQALTPRVEYCRAAATCGGAATYVPASAPPGVSVTVDAFAAEQNA
ncbi:MAG: ArnT family glycosyltransferase [Halobacteriaceae archaeon]